MLGTSYKRIEVKYCIRATNTCSPPSEGVASPVVFHLTTVDVAVVAVVVVVSHIQRIDCQPEKTTLRGGQPRS